MLKEKMSAGRQAAHQLLALFIAFVVMFPIMWVVGMSLDARDVSRPTTLIPPEVSFQAYQRVLTLPTSNPVTFAQLTRNSLSLAGGVAFFSVIVGILAAYIFSRFEFTGRKAFMLGVVGVLMLPSIATIAPLFVILNRITVQSDGTPISILDMYLNSFKTLFAGEGVPLFIVMNLVWITILIGALVFFISGAYRSFQAGLAVRLPGNSSNRIIAIGISAVLAVLAILLLVWKIPVPEFKFNLRNSLWGVGMAMTSASLPFSIWNLKGYLDTIPKELEEAARIDGATFNQVFLRIVLPLARPALAVTFFLGFLTGWTEFALSWQFLTDLHDFTLAMALWNMTGQYSGDTPWSAFSAMALMVSLPVAIVYLALQKQIVSGLTIGGVK